MELEYKKKSRRLKIKLPDDTVKTVMIDDSGLVAQIVKSVVEKLDIKTNPEEWGLRRETASDSKPIIYLFVSWIFLTLLFRSIFGWRPNSPRTRCCRRRRATSIRKEALRYGEHWHERSCRAPLFLCSSKIFEIWIQKNSIIDTLHRPKTELLLVNTLAREVKLSLWPLCKFKSPTVTSIRTSTSPAFWSKLIHYIVIYALN